MRNAFIVIGICLAISGFMGYRLWTMLTTDLVAVQDLMLGLIYYMEANGEFPASEAEFLAAPFVTRDDANNIVIRHPEGSAFNKPHGYPIADLAPFEIRWGSEMADLRIVDREGNLPDPNAPNAPETGTVSDGAGQKVVLIKLPNSPPSGKVYSAILVNAYRDLQADGVEESRATGASENR